MKKIFVFITVVSVCTLLSVPVGGMHGAYSQIVGFQRVTLLPGHNFVGLNFKNVEGGDGFDVQELFDTKPLKGSETRDGAARLVFWDVAAQEYIELWLFDSAGEHPDVDGKWIDRATGDVASRTIFLGDGFWLLNTSENPVEVVLSGEVETVDAFLHVAMDGHNLIASAWPVDKAVNELDVSGFAGGLTRADADRLVLWDVGAQEYVEFWLFDSAGVHPDFDGKWIDRATGDVAGPERVISAGAAVWAIKRTGDELVETRPF